MKYMKLFEDIDWEEDWEEEDSEPFLKKGDVIVTESEIYYWYITWRKGRWYKDFTSKKLSVCDVKHSSDIFEKDTIPYDGYMVRFYGRLPWYKINPSSMKIINNKKYENTNIDFDFEEDWEEEDPDDPYKDYPKNFKEFLIENDALEGFHENMLKYAFVENWKTNIDLFFKEKYKRSWIGSGFSWTKTPEMGIYWSNVDELWRKKNL